MIKILRAQSSDNQQLCDLMSLPMEGAIRVTMERSPDYFAGVQVQSTEPEVYKMQDLHSDQIAACWSVGHHSVYIQGKAVKAIYLSDARIQPKFRKGLLFGRGLKWLDQYLREHPYPALAVIVRDNYDALDFFVNRPLSKKISTILGDYESPAIYLKQKMNLKFKDIPSYEIIRAQSSHIQEIQKFIEQEGSQKNFFPCYHLTSQFNTAFFKALNIENFYLLKSGGEIRAMAGCWDQCSFKHTRIMGYSGLLAKIRKVYNGIQKLSGGFQLPSPGTTLNYFHLHTPLAQNNDPKWFAPLLHHIYNDHCGVGYDYFMVGFDARDPLLNCLKPYTKRSFGGKIILCHSPEIHFPHPEGLFYLDSGRI